MVRRHTKEQLVFYSDVYFFPIYVYNFLLRGSDKQPLYDINNFYIQVYRSLEHVNIEMKNEIHFYPLHFPIELSLQITTEKIKDLSVKAKESVKAKDIKNTLLKSLRLNTPGVQDTLISSDALSTLSFSALSTRNTEKPVYTEYTPISLDSFERSNTQSLLPVSVYNDIFHESESLFEYEIYGWSLIEMSMLNKVKNNLITSSNAGSISKELTNSKTLTNSFKTLGIQTTSKGLLIDNTGSPIEIDNLQQMLSLKNDKNAATINAIVSGLTLISKSDLSLRYPNINVNELFIRSFEITENFENQHVSPLKYFESDSVTELVHNFDKGLLTHTEFQTIIEIVEYFTIFLNDEEVTNDMKAFVTIQLGKVLSRVNLNDRRIDNKLSELQRLESSQSKLTSLELSSSHRTEQNLLPKLSSSLRTEQNLLPSTDFGYENSVVANSGEKKEFVYVYTYLKEYLSMSVDVDKKMNSLRPLLQKSSNSKTILLNIGNDDLFQKEYEQSLNLFTLTLDNSQNPSPLQIKEKLNSLYISQPYIDRNLQTLPFQQLLPGQLPVIRTPGQLPIKRTADRNSVQLPFLSPNERSTDLLRRSTSKLQPNIENRTDLLERLRKLRGQKEKEKERTEAERLRQEEAEAEAEKLRQEEAEAEAEKLRQEEAEARAKRQEDAENLIRSFWIIFSIMVFTVLIGIILYRYYYDYFNNFSFVRLITRWRSG